MIHPKVSIIVPIYNVEKYLTDCIESILKQSYSNFELILINDGSTDNSGQICDYFKIKDNRIKVIHKKNGGVSVARNLGLKLAKGKWICFVDSDDWLKSNTLESLIQCENDNIDFIQFGFEHIKSNGEIITKSHLPQKNISVNVDLYCSDFFYHSAICGYFIRKELIIKNNIYFPTFIKYGEDQAFILKVVMCCNTIKIINKHLYYYRYRADSVMNVNLSLPRATDHLKVIEDVLIFANNSNFTITPLHKRLFTAFIKMYFKIGVESVSNLRDLTMLKETYSSFCYNIKKQNKNLYYRYSIMNSYFSEIIFFLYFKIYKYLKQLFSHEK